MSWSEVLSFIEKRTIFTSLIRVHVLIHLPYSRIHPKRLLGAVVVAAPVQSVQVPLAATVTVAVQADDPPPLLQDVTVVAGPLTVTVCTA